MKATPEELKLIDDIAEFYADPLGFVNYVFDWGAEHTVLQDETGPDQWQTDVLEDIGNHVRNGLINNVEEALQLAVASGHGIGKTTLVSWIILWFISTREFPQIIVTANTKNQLTSKTWRELAKWHRMAIHSHWFKWTATKFYHVDYPDVWFAMAIPWSENKSEAFAGAHEKHILILFDEASAIADVIWEVASGAMTTPGSMMICFGNPTKNTGQFRECFGKYRHRWNRRQIDSRTAKMADKKQIQKWIDDYGEDSDFVRVRVRGVFPKASSSQFISTEVVEECQNMNLPEAAYLNEPLIMGIDVARQGDDASVIALRQGRKLFPLMEFRIDDSMQLVGHITEAIDKYEPAVVFFDFNGLGAPIWDRLVQLGYNTVPVNWSKPARHPTKFFNQRSEMWAAMREWLTEGADIPGDDEALRDDLITPEYGFANNNSVQLQSKDDMKSKGFASPDRADAVAMTFANNVSKRASASRRRIVRPRASSWRSRF